MEKKLLLFLVALMIALIAMPASPKTAIAANASPSFLASQCSGYEAPLIRKR